MPGISDTKNIQLLAADKNILLKEAREILQVSHLAHSPSFNVINFPPLSPSSETFAHFTSDFPSLSLSSLSLPSRNHTYAQAAQAVRIPFSSISRTGNKNNTNHPTHSTRPPKRDDHDYLLEPNGRPSYRPPDGCALPSWDTISRNPPSMPTGNSENQLGAILHLLIQIINTLSSNLSSPLPSNYSNYTHPLYNN